MTTTWTSDEHGNKVFKHEGWEVEIWGPEWPHSRISVTSPIRGAEVEVNESGVWVKGESETRGWEGPSPEAFTIPWPVVKAIIEAQSVVGS
jgi:hypothetical protein